MVGQPDETAGLQKRIGPMQCCRCDQWNTRKGREGRKEGRKRRRGIVALVVRKGRRNERCIQTYSDSVLRWWAGRFSGRLWQIRYRQFDGVATLET